MLFSLKICAMLPSAPPAPDGLISYPPPPQPLPMPRYLAESLIAPPDLIDESIPSAPEVTFICFSTRVYVSGMRIYPLSPLITTTSVVTDAESIRRAYEYQLEALKLDQEKKYLEAIAACKSAHYSNPQDPIILYTRGRILYRLSQTQNAPVKNLSLGNAVWDIFKSLQLYKPAETKARSDAQNLLGELHLQLNMENEAVQWFQSATQTDPSNADAWSNLGKYFQKYDPTTAWHYYQQALSLAPENSTYHFNAATVLFDLAQNERTPAQKNIYLAHALMEFYTSATDPEIAKDAGISIDHILKAHIKTKPALRDAFNALKAQANPIHHARMHAIKKLAKKRLRQLTNSGCTIQ